MALVVPIEFKYGLLVKQLLAEVRHIMFLPEKYQRRELSIQTAHAHAGQLPHATEFFQGGPKAMRRMGKTPSADTAMG